MIASKSSSRAASAAVRTAAKVEGTLAPSSNSLIRSISAMTWAPDGKLIVADWKSNALFALALPQLSAQAEGSFNLHGVDDAIATSYSTSRDQIQITATIYDQVSQNAVLAVEVNQTIVLASVETNGHVSLYNPGEFVADQFGLQDSPEESDLWSQIPTRSFLVTAMETYGEEIVLAGLANADFSSTLRRVPYPFIGSAATITVEMYHAVHNQIETRAPIRAFAIFDLEGIPTLLAAYTCTPLVTVPISDLQDRATVRGKTIAELGYGNTPLDIVPFEIDYQGQTSRWVIIANSSRAADLISMDAIATTIQHDGLSEPVQVPFQTQAGVPSIPAPITNTIALMDQDRQFLLALRRDPVQGDLQLVSIRKGAFFRLSDFVNEYDFPNYTYPETDQFQQGYIRPFHQMMKADEGYPELMK